MLLQSGTIFPAVSTLVSYPVASCNWDLWSTVWRAASESFPIIKRHTDLYLKKNTNLCLLYCFSDSLRYNSSTLHVFSKMFHFGITLQLCQFLSTFASPNSCINFWIYSFLRITNTIRSNTTQHKTFILSRFNTFISYQFTERLSDSLNKLTKWYYSRYMERQ